MFKDAEHLAARLLTRHEMLLDLFREALDGEVGDIDKQLAEQWYPRLGLMVSRFQSITGLSKSFFRADDLKESPTARWVNLVESGIGQDFEFHSAPVSAASHATATFMAELFCCRGYVRYPDCAGTVRPCA